MSAKASKQLDVDFVRQCFPAFAEPLPARTAFFENAGGSYVAGPVLDHLTHFYRANKVQPYGANAIQRAAGEQMDRGRHTMAQLLGVDSDRITLGPSTTQNINTLAMACAPLLRERAEIIVTEQDHEANIGAWERLAARSNATLHLWQADAQSGELLMADFDKLLSPATALVCVTHSSNIIGTLNPVEKIVERCRGNGTRVVVDGVSCAPHQWPDLPALQPDAYCFSTYKTYATHLGVMYTAADFAAELDPQCHYFNLGYGEKLLDAAGPDHASIAALAGLGDYFSSSYRHHFSDAPSERPASLYQQAQQVSELMHRHESMLCARLLDGIANLPIRIIGKNTVQGREANIAMVSSKHSSASLAQALADEDVAVGNGDFYARRLIERAGVADVDDGVLRLSMAHYNTGDEVDRALSALQAVH